MKFQLKKREINLKHYFLLYLMCYITHQWFIWTTRNFFIAPKRSQKIIIIFFHFCHGGETHFLVLAHTLIYVRVQMKTSQSCPKVILRSDTSFLGMKHRVWEEKLMYTIQLKRLEEKGLAKQRYQEQKEQLALSKDGQVWPKRYQTYVLRLV